MDLELIKEEKLVSRRTAVRPAKVELGIVLEQHRQWVQSGGQNGRQADFSRMNLEGADLTDTNLQRAVLNEAVLKGADLLLTDLQGASLMQANLEGANLLGARLREANLQGANLQNATGLLAAELAGTNLTFAKLPAEVETAEDLKYLSRRGRHANGLAAAFMVLNALACWRILTVSDTLILRNAALLPFPILRNGVPLAQFFLLSPLVIGALYLWFHVYLQRFWEATASMPAVLESGTRLDQALPWIVSWPARNYFKWLRGRRSALAGVEKVICILLLYWMAPATMILFWGRYLTLQDVRGTTLHAVLIAAVTSAAIHFPRSAARAFRGEHARFSFGPSDTPEIVSSSALDTKLDTQVETKEEGSPKRSFLSAYSADAKADTKAKHVAAREKRGTPLELLIGATLGLILCVLSVGAIAGAPHGGGAGQGVSPASPVAWAADALWLVGYDPFAHVNEAEISRKPLGWSDADGEIGHVQGASLNGFRLRYLEAYGAFLVRARLRRADLSHALLSEADLRQANLRQASLRSADLNQARLDGAFLQSADLEKANLIRAELTKADLSFALLSAATLLDAKLDGAVLYGADLRNSWLERASLEGADLRQANLEGANLKGANLRAAYLSTGKMAGARLAQAQLPSAILMGADLQHADLSNSNLQGAVVSEADLSGANLQSADLRGVVGLKAGQLCAAANAASAQLDDALAAEVSSRCPAKR